MDPMKPDDGVREAVRRPARKVLRDGDELSEEQLESIVGGMSYNWGSFGDVSLNSAPSAPIPLPFPNNK